MGAIAMRTGDAEASRLFVWLVALIASGFLIAACSSTTGSGEPTTDAAASSETAPSLEVAATSAPIATPTVEAAPTPRPRATSTPRPLATSTPKATPETEASGIVLQFDGVTGEPIMADTERFLERSTTADERACLEADPRYETLIGTDRFSDAEAIEAATLLIDCAASQPVLGMLTLQDQRTLDRTPLPVAFSINECLRTELGSATPDRDAIIALLLGISSADVDRAQARLRAVDVIASCLPRSTYVDFVIEVNDVYSLPDYVPDCLDGLLDDATMSAVVANVVDRGDFVSTLGDQSLDGSFLRCRDLAAGFRELMAAEGAPLPADTSDCLDAAFESDAVIDAILANDPNPAVTATLLDCLPTDLHPTALVVLGASE